LKITDVTVRRYSVSRDPRAYAGDIHIVQVHTDSDVTGVGFVTAASATSDVAAALVRRTLKAAVVGEDPLLTEDLWRRMYEAVPRRGGEGVVRAGTSRSVRAVMTVSLPQASAQPVTAV